MMLNYRGGTELYPQKHFPFTIYCIRPEFFIPSKFLLSKHNLTDLKVL